MEPFEQEERRQAEWDNQPHADCDCCGHRIYAGERLYRIAYRRDMILTFCEDCKTTLDDSEEVFEVDYGD